jgi:hypothetical protein
MLDFSIDTSDPTAQGGPVSPDSMKRKRALADALITQGADTSPLAGGTWAGLARVAKAALGGYENSQLDRQERAGMAASARNFSSGLSGLAGGEPDSTPGNPPLATGVPMGMVKPGMPQPAGSTPDGWKGETSSNGDPVYTQDQLNPMDEPRGDARKKMIATMLSEEPAGSPSGLGVANVIRNRAVDGGYGGNTPDAVVQSPNQFSAWNGPGGAAKVAAYLQNPSAVAKANDQVDQAYGVGKYASAGPNDPTEGKTHFYDPQSMVPPNRVPSWAQGKEYQTIGSTRFFDDPNDNSQTPPNAQMAQGQLPSRSVVQGPQVAQNGRPNVNVLNWANSVLNDPYANASQKQVAASVLQKTITPKEDAWSSAGNGYVMNSRTGEVKKGYESDDKKPASVAEYEYYTKNFQSTAEQPRPMPYDTWSTAKSRAGATNISNNIDMNSGQTYDKQLAEGLGKSHAALANGVEDAQSRARDLAAMQGAVDAIQNNGGTTGGMGQAQILELKKTLNAGASGLGVTTPFDEKDISDKEFLTKFNRQIAGAQAKGAVGSRVTNFEMSNYLKANPGLEMSVTGNQRLIGIQSQIEQRNVAVGNQVRDATAQAISRGQKIDPVTVQKIITNYDQAHHVQDPVTGQDLTQSYTLPEFQKPEQGTNAGLAAGHETNMKKMRVWNPQTGKLE